MDFGAHGLIRSFHFDPIKNRYAGSRGRAGCAHPANTPNALQAGGGSYALAGNVQAQQLHEELFGATFEHGIVLFDHVRRIEIPHGGRPIVRGDGSFKAAEKAGDGVGELGRRTRRTGAAGAGRERQSEQADTERNRAGESDGRD